MIAIVMVVALVVAFASIATYAASCPYCTSGNTVTTTTDTFIGNKTYAGCPNYRSSHIHQVKYTTTNFQCRSCVKTFKGTPYYIYNKCPYA